MLKKAILSILSSLIVFASFAPFMVANAQSPAPAAPSPAPASWYNQDFQSWFSKVYDDTNPNEIFGERYTAAQVQWIIYSIMAFIINQTTNADVVGCLLKNGYNIEACKDLLSAGLPPSNVAVNPPSDGESLLSKVFADRSFSGITYLKNNVRNFSVVPTAHAQQAGFGFDALLPVQDMWRASRDMAFSLFVVAAIILAFMIMFRVKISPQVVISVQSAIPKLIISLIFVTFSYAIAGLMVDLMYIVYGILSVMGTAFVPIVNVSPTGLFDFLTKGEIGVGFLGGEGPDLGVFGLIALYPVIFAIAFIIALFSTLGVIGSLIAGAIGALFVVSPLGQVMLIIGLIGFIIIVLLIIWNGIKTMFALIKAFTMILLLTIFAPIQIVAGTVIPNLGFSQWLKSFASQLAVFVVTSVLFLFSYIFLLLAIKTPFMGTIWDRMATTLFGSAITARFSGPSAWPPLMNGSDGLLAFMYLGASFILFTLIPKATEVVQGLISGRPYAYGTAIGEAFEVPYDLSGARNRVEGYRRERGQRSAADDVTRIENYFEALGKRLDRIPGVSKVRSAAKKSPQGY